VQRTSCPGQCEDQLQQVEPGQAREHQHGNGELEMRLAINCAQNGTAEKQQRRDEALVHQRMRGEDGTGADTQIVDQHVAQDVDGKEQHELAYCDAEIEQ